MDLQEQAVPHKERMCHWTGFEKRCQQLVGDGSCKRWHSQEVFKEGKLVVLHGCEDTWAFQYARENAVNIVGAQAATESFRNEFCRRHDEDRRVAAEREERERLARTTSGRLIDGGAP